MKPKFVFASKLRLQTSSSRRPLAARIATLASLAFASLGQAAPFYWTGDNNSLWNTTGGANGTNWSSSGDFNNGTGGLPSAADDVFFNLAGAGNLSNQLGANFSIRSLTFTPDAASSVTIGGANTLTLGTGGLTNNSIAANSIAAAVTLGVNQTWSNNTATPVTVSGAVAGAGVNLTFGGAGAFNFTGANSYSGSTSLGSNGTTLSLKGATGTLATSSISLEGGTSLNLDNTAGNNADRIGNSIAISSRGATIALKGSSATETLGALTLPTGTTRVSVDAGSVLTLSSLTRSAGGTINFSSTGTSNLSTSTLTNGILGAYATLGNVGSLQQDAAGPNLQIGRASCRERVYLAG